MQNAFNNNVQGKNEKEKKMIIIKTQNATEIVFIDVNTTFTSTYKRINK